MNQPKKPFEPEREQPVRGIAFVGVGFEVIGLVVGSVIVGGYLDRKFGLNGIITATMVIVAMIVWFIHLLYLLRRQNEDKNTRD